MSYPYNECLRNIIESKIPIVSIDCPTGWTSDSPNELNPEMLISLTAPKECVKHFIGKYHIIGGRFIPKELPNEFFKLYKINNLYKGDEMFVEI